MEHAVVEMLALVSVHQHARVSSSDILPSGNKEVRGSAGRVADLVFGTRRGHLDHELDDVPRGAELTVDTGAGEVAQQILVQVAVGVAVLHFPDAGEQRRG